VIKGLKPENDRQAILKIERGKLMPRKPRDLAKEHYWRSLLEEWQASAINGAEYCRRHGINYSQFKDWQKIIRRRDAESADSRSVERGRTRGRPRKGAAAQAEVPSAAQNPSEFVSAKLRNSVVPSGTGRGAADMDIILRCGTTLRINSMCPLSFVVTVVSALENR
jgi:hypothetical protein